MITFPHAKINLGLRVTSRRPDGFHNIETIMYPIGLCDALDVVIAEDGHGGSFEDRLPRTGFTQSGIQLPDDGHPNTCMRACEALQQHLASTGRTLPPVRTHLHKCIPAGAGLGGGSADAAFMLMALNELLSLALTTDELRSIAASTGSDCSFFIHDGAGGRTAAGNSPDPKPMLATGRGEILEPVSIPSLQGYHLLLLTPPVHVSTAGAYAQITPSPAKTSLLETIADPVRSWRGRLVNDFEAVAFPSHPTIKNLKDTLYRAGAAYAALSGSGASVFGLFEKDPDAAIRKMFPGCHIWQQSL